MLGALLFPAAWRLWARIEYRVGAGGESGTGCWLIGLGNGARGEGRGR